MSVTLLLCSVVLGATSPQGMPRADARVFLETVVDRADVFVGERFVVAIRVGIEREFLRDNLVQPFRRKLDLPVHLMAAWFDDPVGAVRSAVQPRGDGPRVALGSEIVAAFALEDQDREGASFAVCEIRRAFVAGSGDRIEIPSPHLRYAFATQFGDSLLDGRVALDRRDGECVGQMRSVAVHPLPESGRPADFSGAVGRFVLRTHCDPAEVEVGGTLRLLLRIEGDGELAAVEPPRLGAIPGVHVVGRIEIEDPTARMVGYDLVVDRPDVVEIPAVTLSTFDPTPPGAWRAVRSNAVPLHVRGDANAPGASRGDGLLEPLSFVAAPRATRPATAWVVFALLFPGLAALGLSALLRARARGAADVVGNRARGAAAAFRAAAGDGETVAAFTEYLASRLCCTHSAVITHDLADRLRRAGVGQVEARRAAEWLERATAARYGAGAIETSDAIALVEELEAEFRKAELGP